MNRKRITRGIPGEEGILKSKSLEVITNKSPTNAP